MEYCSFSLATYTLRNAPDHLHLHPFRIPQLCVVSVLCYKEDSSFLSRLLALACVLLQGVFPSVNFPTDLCPQKCHFIVDETKVNSLPNVTLLAISRGRNQMHGLRTPKGAHCCTLAYVSPSTILLYLK